MGQTQSGALYNTLIPLVLNSICEVGMIITTLQKKKLKFTEDYYFPRGYTLTKQIRPNLEACVWLWPLHHFPELYTNPWQLITFGKTALLMLYK